MERERIFKMKIARIAGPLAPGASSIEQDHHGGQKNGRSGDTVRGNHERPPVTPGYAISYIYFFMTYDFFF